VTRNEADARMDAGGERGWVYLLEARKGGPVKIGWARDPEKRMKSLQTAHAEQLTLLAVIPGTRWLEQEIHRKLIFARCGGEWFEPGAAMRLLRPIIAEFGLKLAIRAEESRNSPERRRYGQHEKREYVIVLQDVS
jgi:hypothetical protein